MHIRQRRHNRRSSCEDEPGGIPTWPIRTWFLLLLWRDQEMPYRIVGGLDPSSRRCCAVCSNFACLFDFYSTRQRFSILAIDPKICPSPCQVPPWKHRWLRLFHSDHKVAAQAQFKTAFLSLLIHHLPKHSHACFCLSDIQICIWNRKQQQLVARLSVMKTYQLPMKRKGYWIHQRSSLQFSFSISFQGKDDHLT